MTIWNIAARAAVALEAFIGEKQLDGFAYYYESRSRIGDANPGDEFYRRQLATDIGRISDVRRVRSEGLVWRC